MWTGDEMMNGTLRGYAIHIREDGKWIFSDTNEPVITTHKLRPCGFCKRMDTPEGYDGCLGKLPGVRNACCGHGELKGAYIQFIGGFTVRGFVARWVSVVLKIVGWVLK